MPRGWFEGMGVQEQCEAWGLRRLRQVTLSNPSFVGRNLAWSLLSAVWHCRNECRVSHPSTTFLNLLGHSYWPLSYRPDNSPLIFKSTTTTLCLSLRSATITLPSHHPCLSFPHLTSHGHPIPTDINTSKTGHPKSGKSKGRGMKRQFKIRPTPSGQEERVRG